MRGRPVVLLTVPTLVCFTTVGRLWLVPAALLLAGVAVGVDDWRAVGRTAAAGWTRLLLGALGGCQLLMAATAAPPDLVVGLAGGLALIAAAVIGPRRRALAGGLVALGTVPFAVAAWTALVPVLVLAVAGVLALGLLAVGDPQAHAAVGTTL